MGTAAEIGGELAFQADLQEALEMSVGEREQILGEEALGGAGFHEALRKGGERLSENSTVRHGCFSSQANGGLVTDSFV
jgi:hypothetical protein